MEAEAGGRTRVRATAGGRGRARHVCERPAKRPGGTLTVLGGQAFKMDRILGESDKYMSMDSSIDDLLNDALSKRRARSIVASSGARHTRPPTHAMLTQNARTGRPRASSGDGKGILSQF